MNTRGASVLLFLACASLCLAASVATAADPPKQQSPPKAAEPPMQPPPNAAESPNQPPPTAAEYPMQHPKTPEPPKLKGRVKFRKCIAAFHSAKGTCLKEIYASYWHHRLNIGEDCCKAIREADDHCAETIFSLFKNPTEPYLCSIVEGVLLNQTMITSIERG